MTLLTRERETLNALFPSLDDELAALPLMQMEQPGNPAIPLFREHKGTSLLIPHDYEGKGATPLQALRVQVAIANRSPSLAVATTMHHFSVASVVEMVQRKVGSGFEWMLLQGIAKNNLYVASGFAEGRSGAGILNSSMKVERNAEGLIINGSKKPCSLSSSMNLLTASLVIHKDDGEPELAIATIPAETAGITRRPFWKSPILAGAESDEVILENVSVPSMLVSYLGSPSQLDLIQARGFLWFELLISGSYLGVATALAERCLEARKGNPSERVSLVTELEGAMAALEGIAAAMTETAANEDQLLARALFVRYAVQGAIERATARAVELLGGMSFINSSDVSYLYSAARGLAFHPPSRTSIANALDQHLDGEPLLIQ
ncbi:MAG TPA: acyl-CoA dehydrogenase family protein [Pyrinomonadaceae bacterium]|nr:acyl-CoA dehydrogenase family protein [Pyrinomonadaceae bacterium]